MSRSVGGWNGSFDSGSSRIASRSRSWIVASREVLMGPALSFCRLLSSDNKRTLLTMQRKTQSPDRARVRRKRTDIREALLESALVEFGAKGFDGASTRAIGARVEAHQPQIKIHLEPK